MKKYLFILIILFILLYLYMRYVEIDLFETHEYTIEVANIPNTFDGLKIVHFSDTLINEHYTIEELEVLVDEINNLEPDLVFFTGDLVDDTYELNNNDILKISDILNKIYPSLYKFSIVGDNDAKILNHYESIMDSSNFILLDNESYPLFYKDNNPIKITGLTNTNNIEESYTLADDLVSAYNITLVHTPDIVDNLSDKSNLIFSGHSLGGYIDVPFLEPILRKDGATKYYDGMYTVNTATLYVSNGIGVENTPLRFLNKPSINLYRISIK